MCVSDRSASMCFGLLTKSFCSADKEKMEKAHAVALKHEKDEVANLKTQLSEIAEAHKVEMEQATSEKNQLEEDVQQLRRAAEASEDKARLAEEAAQRFQTRIDAWAAEFKKVQENMHGETHLCLMFPS